MKYWLAMWDEFGFESILNITDCAPEYEAFRVLADESDGNAELNRIIFYMKMRAQFNSQRSYEIYGFKSTDDIDDTSLHDWANDNPQSLVDFIRENGVSIFKKAIPSTTVRIT